ncbi:hypothetical protein [Natrarchaeobaculum sulfurireducens]|uniref:Uncharacterized protein n=1 Tax=Natrarchaeobaculum sulfurireducens TaxID=2044521 RepID=A0A346PN90_9EURY|nr:hypothetical protein [Natrarchaeobaculum sulfurireducens]AXR80985.1 hypothetical protein AArcMg_0967 [Natrarchaeobaculum sulfurireducens]
MCNKDPAGRENARQSDRSIAFETSAADCTTASDDAEIPILERPQVSVEDAARVLADLKDSRPTDRELETARAFDAAERRADRPRRLWGKPTLGGQRYLTMGETPEAWLTTNYVLAAGDVR